MEIERNVSPPLLWINNCFGRNIIAETCLVDFHFLSKNLIIVPNISLIVIKSRLNHSLQNVKKKKKKKKHLLYAFKNTTQLV